MFSIDGLASGLDTSSIIEGLLSIQRSQLDRLSFRKEQILFKQSAFKGIEAHVLTLQSSAGQLSSFTNNIFAVRRVISSDETILTASATAEATEGNFVVRVKGLAHAEQIASQGFQSTESLITHGTLKIRVGQRSPIDVEITSQNNTVQGMVDSINNATDDVTATVVNDGTSVRVLLTSAYTGAANTIAVTNDFKPAGVGEIEPDFSGPVVQAASDSEIVLGSGAGAITIRQPTNLIDGVIEGVTLNLLDVDSNKEIGITVERDVEPARTAIEEFVAAFNNLMNYIQEQTRYDNETETAGVLLGHSPTSTIRDQIRNALARVVPNLNNSANRLSSIGIRFDNSGQLQINSAQLDDALQGKLDNVSIDDVHRLFALGAQIGDSNIEFILGSTNTKPSEQPYILNITQAAQRAKISSSLPLAPSIDIDDSNNQLSVTIDGVKSEALTLSNGTYTPQELAAHLQQVINASADLNGRTVSVTTDGTTLSIESNSYGSRSEVGNLEGSALPALGMNGTENDTGLDVAGYFEVNGETETATGNGRILSGDAGNQNTDGLQLRVTLSSVQVGAGFQTDLTITQGFASQLDALIQNLQNIDHGRFKHSNDAFDQQVASIDQSITRLDELFELKQQQLISEFIAIETTLSQLQTTSSFLTAQLGTANSLL